MIFEVPERHSRRAGIEALGLVMGMMIARVERPVFLVRARPRQDLPRLIATRVVCGQRPGVPPRPLRLFFRYFYLCDFGVGRFTRLSPQDVALPNLECREPQAIEEVGQVLEHELDIVPVNAPFHALGECRILERLEFPAFIQHAVWPFHSRPGPVWQAVARSNTRRREVRPGAAVDLELDHETETAECLGHGHPHGARHARFRGRGSERTTDLVGRGRFHGVFAYT